MFKKLLTLIGLSFIALIQTPTYCQKIGFLIDSYVMDRWYLDHKFFEEKVKSLGGECRVENPFGDADEQVRIGKKMVDEGVNVLVVVAIDSEKARALVDYAYSKNVPVICYDRLINSNKIASYITYNPEIVGQLAAQSLIKQVPAGKYVLVNGPRTDNNAILQRKGQLAILQPLIDEGKITLVGDIIQQDWSEIETLMKFDAFLMESEMIPDAVIAGNDVLANGVIQVLPKDQWGKVKIAGQDADLTALRNIIAGNQLSTIYKPIKPLAELAAETAMNIKTPEKIRQYTQFKSEGISVNALFLEPICVTKDNITETVIKDGHVNISQVFQKN